MIGRPEYTLTLPPPCPTNRDHLRLLEDRILDDSDRDYLETLHESFVRVVADVKLGLH